MVGLAGRAVRPRAVGIASLRTARPLRVPNVTHHELTEEQRQILALSPRVKEVYHRYNLDYHTPRSPSGDSMILAVGFHVAEAVYAPLYFGYGGEGEYADHRKLLKRKHPSIHNDSVRSRHVLPRSPFDRLRANGAIHGTIKQKWYEPRSRSARPWYRYASPMSFASSFSLIWKECSSVGNCPLVTSST